MGDWKEKMFAPTASHVSIVQALFDAYQVECFKARPPEFFCLELCGETGELANLEKKLWKGKRIDHRDVADEAADVFIALMNYCNARGINLGDAIGDKLERIETKRLELLSKGESY